MRPTHGATVLDCAPPCPCLGQATLSGVLHSPLCHDTLDAIDAPTNARALLASRGDPLAACEFVADCSSCQGTKCHSQRVTIRYSHASSRHGARCPSSVRLVGHVKTCEKKYCSVRPALRSMRVRTSEDPRAGWMRFIRDVIMANLHVLLCSIEDVASLAASGDNSTAVWIVPKGAQPGDEALFFSWGTGVVAKGTIASPPKPNKRWGRGRYGAKISDIFRFDPPIKIKKLSDALPDWAWLRYPKMYTTPAEEIAEVLRNFASAPRNVAKRQGAVQQRSNRQNKRVEPSPTVSLQGRPEHQQMQKNLADLGILKNYQLRTNYDIGAGFKPDVLWFRLDPSKHSNAAPIAVFEIEFGSAQAIAKSMASLKHAFDLGTHKLFLILPSGRVDVAKLRLNGAFHEIAEAINVLPIEDMIGKTSLELARYLRV